MRYLLAYLRQLPPIKRWAVWGMLVLLVVTWVAACLVFAILGAG